MKAGIISDKSAIHNFISKNPALYLYLIGDLDDFFWPHTKWYALTENNRIKSVALLYSRLHEVTPTFLLFHENGLLNASKLLKEIKKELPDEFNAHLSPGLTGIFGKENILADYGHNFRMILREQHEPVIDNNIRRLEPGDLEEIMKLYELSYPGNWFDSRMVETGRYFGYWLDTKLAGIAGIHVFSSEYRVAALGNIATHPDYRGRKIAFKLTCTLCNDIKNDADTIGLNVKSDNLPAIKCYENAGFEITGSYDECLIRNV